MLNKDELRKKLMGMPAKEAVVLAETETAFWDVHYIHKLTSFKAIVEFLLTWTPPEAVGLLKQMEPLAAGLLLARLKALASQSNAPQGLVAILELYEEVSAVPWED